MWNLTAKAISRPSVTLTTNVNLPATNTSQQTFDNEVHYQNGISALYTKSNEHSDMQEPVK
jgi:hypothetical protein